MNVVLAFPQPCGLTQDDLERLYCFMAKIPGAQIDILIGRSRRTSAVLAVAGRQWRVERQDDAIWVRDASGGSPPGSETAIGDLTIALQAAASTTDEPRQPVTA